ncbi:DUF262 domain-containing protein [Winogradskyella sediminis]|uniref:DUF262 domain-containing protein n=1 Tax=Winogradskyella sediminis TaxID=1382466 RepID=UPI003AA935F8
MKFEVTKWTIADLSEKYEQGHLNLSPKYQRNFIWSIKDQQHLIRSISKNNPIPNFFILEKKSNDLEMVDGQQRSRTILGFLKEQFKDFNGEYYSKERYKDFLNYTFPITIISDTEGESIENFYALVNKTGIHLNKPEVRKADYYDTNLLKLINELTYSKKITKLKLFSQTALKRMNDTDFISELIILMIKGHVEKKSHIDDYFKKDISIKESKEIKRKFNEVIKKISLLNELYEISKTRYKQRNDFYTLFDFVYNNKQLKSTSLSVFYKILVLISKDIKPSQEECKPLMEYARNCVTQSNSKSARENRLKFYNELFLNDTGKPNENQIEILRFYDLKENNMKTVEEYLTISEIDLNRIKQLTFNVEI